MVIALQRLLNNWGIKGANGKPLTEDGIRGYNTNFAIAKAKELLKIILR